MSPTRGPKILLLVGGVAAVAKIASAKKAEWSGLTEPEVRAKLDRKFGAKMPAEKRTEVADKVVGAMRDKGMLKEEAEATPSEES